jgi:hypothetical protein
MDVTMVTPYVVSNNICVEARAPDWGRRAIEIARRRFA